MPPRSSRPRVPKDTDTDHGNDSDWDGEVDLAGTRQQLFPRGGPSADAARSRAPASTSRPLTAPFAMNNAPQRYIPVTVRRPVLADPSIDIDAPRAGGGRRYDTLVIVEDEVELQRRGEETARALQEEERVNFINDVLESDARMARIMQEQVGRASENDEDLARHMETIWIDSGRDEPESSGRPRASRERTLRPRPGPAADLATYRRQGRGYATEPTRYSRRSASRRASGTPIRTIADLSSDAESTQAADIPPLESDYHPALIAQSRRQSPIMLAARSARYVPGFPVNATDDTYVYARPSTYRSETTSRRHGTRRPEEGIEVPSRHRSGREGEGDVSSSRRYGHYHGARAAASFTRRTTDRETERTNLPLRSGHIGSGDGLGWFARFFTFPGILTERSRVMRDRQEGVRRCHEF